MAKHAKKFHVDPSRAHREKRQASKLPKMTAAQLAARERRRQKRALSSGCHGCPPLDSGQDLRGLDHLFAVEHPVKPSAEKEG